MSMKGSPINWWKEKRQSSHSGIPHASRPQTAFPWNPDADRDLSKIVEAAVLSAFESTAFKIAVASQVDPAFTRHQEKLNQIKATGLNLESVLQGHVEDLPELLKGVEGHVTGLNIPDYGDQFEVLTAGQEKLRTRIDEIRIPDYADQFGGLKAGHQTLERRIDELRIPDYREELNEIISGQGKFLKTFESRVSAIESRLEDLDRKTSDLDESVVNADLRSAIRFGEISNELQDRNTTLNNSIWEVQRELGKKVDALQRRVVGACEEMGKVVRGCKEVIEGVRAKIEEDDVLGAVGKVSSRAEFAEKGFRRSLAGIQDKVALLDTSPLIGQSAKLEGIERAMADFKKEAEAARNLASVSSKFLSANTTKLDGVATAVGKVHLLAEATNETVQEVSEALETNASAMREDVEAVRLHVRSLDNLAVSHARKLSDTTTVLTRMEGADALVMGRLGDLKEVVEGVEEKLRPLSSHGTKLEGLESSLTGLIKESKPQRMMLNDLTTTLSEMRTNVDSALSSHTDSLSTIHKTVSNAHSKDALSSALSNLQSSIEKKISSSHETSSQSTIEAIATHVSSLDGKIQTGFRSMKADTESQTSTILSPISEIMTELRSSKTLLETENATVREELKTTRDAIEASQLVINENGTAVKILIQDLQESTKDDEILLQIESWAQSCIAKQATEVATVRDLLDISRSRDEDLKTSVSSLAEKSTEILDFLKSGDVESSCTIRDLEVLKSILENGEGLGGLRDITKSTAQTLLSVQTSIREMQADETLKSVKDLAAENTAAIATVNTAVLGLDSQLKTSEENVLSTVRVIQTALGKEILDAKTGIMTAAHDDVAEMKTDFTSCISTSTNVLRSEIKNVDLSSTLGAIEALKSDLENSVVKNEEYTRGIGEELKASIGSLKGDVKDLDDVVAMGLQSNVSEFSGLKELSTANMTALSAELAKLQESVTPISEVVEGVVSIAGLVKDIDSGVKENGTSLSGLQESLAANASQSSSQFTELTRSVDGVGLETLQSLESTHALLTEVQKSNTEGFTTTHSTISSIESALAKSCTEISSANTALASLSVVCEDIPRIRENVEKAEAAAGKMEKMVLASAAGISAEILSVKSEIDGLTATSARAETLAKEAGQTQSEVLSVARDSSADLGRIQEAVQQVEEENKSHFNAVKTLITGLGDFIGKETAELQAGIQTVTGGVKDIATAVSQSATENNLAHAATLAAFATESRGIRDSIVNEAEKTNETFSSNLETVKISIVGEVENSKTLLSAVHQDLTSGVKDITAAVQQASSESTQLHGVTLGAVAAESKIVQDTLTTSAEKTNESLNSGLSAAKEDISSVQTSVKESRDVLDVLSTNVNQKLDETILEASKRHEAALAALSAESKTTQEVVTTSAEKTNESLNSKFDGIQGTLASELSRTKEVLVKDIASVQSSLKESRDVLDGLSTNLNKKLDKAVLEASKTHESTLAALSAESKTILNTITAESEKTATTISLDLETAKSSIISEIDSSSALVFADLTAIKASTQRSHDILTVLSTEATQTNSKLEYVAAEAEKAHLAVVAAIEEQKRVLCDALTKEVGGLNSAVGVVGTKIEEKVGGVEIAVLGGLEGVKREVEGVGKNVTERTEKLSTDLIAGFSKADSNYETTINAIEKEGKNLSEVVLSESKATEVAIGAAKDATLLHIQQSKGSVVEKLDSVEKEVLVKFGETNGTIMKEFDVLTSKTNERQNIMLEALKNSSLETVTAVEKTSTRNIDILSKEIGAGFEKAGSNHGLTLEALKAAASETVSTIERTSMKSRDALSQEIGTGFKSMGSNHETAIETLKSSSTTIAETIVREIGTSTTATTTGVQSLLTEISKTHDSITTLQTTTTTLSTETATSFSHAAAARKKALKHYEGHVDTILEAIRQQGKTTSSCVDAVQKVVLTGLQNMNSSLEGYVSQEGVAARKSIEDVTALINNKTTNLEGQLNNGFEGLSKESTTASRAMDAHVNTLSAAIKDEAETTQARVETLHSRVLDEVQKTDTALRSSVTSLKTSIEATSKTHAETQHAMQAEIKTLTPSLKAIDAAVRVNSAAIARVDKAVLEAASQVKSEVHSSIQGMSGQLEDEISEMGRRIRGIAEFEIPRLEALARRQRDAVEVIGGRIIGTTKKFDEMVANVGKGNGGLDKSELLGMSGRLRGGSNASSTRSKDSGYRMGAFESGGRM